MNCCCVYVDEVATVMADKVRKARKDHICCECGVTIPAGSLHSVEATVFDGEFAAYRTCARCRNIRDEYFPRGFYWGRMVDDFKDCFGFDYRDGLPADFAPCRPGSRIEVQHG